MNNTKLQHGKTANAKETALSQGNKAFREKKYETAVALYLKALRDNSGLARTIAANVVFAKQKYRAQRHSSQRQKVAVCGWELAHNPAGRVYTLAKLYETFADVEIIGSLFPKFGRELWEPIRGTAIPVHSFVVEDESRFLDQALELVAAHPYDIVHLSKPRVPNIFFGILYKLIWDAKVLVDIDDEELAFVGAETPISIEDYLKAHGKLPELKGLAEKDWTRLAVGMASEFDGITVSNPALQKRYGGEIIRHARDEKLFQPSPELKSKCREKFGIPQDKKVVLFFGTPREHKGLLETADAIAAQKRKDILFVIVGDFPNPELKGKLQAKKGVEFVFIGNQPFESIPEVVAIGDCCVLLQDPDAPVAQFQIPAKLTDALGGGLTVITNGLLPLSDIVAEGGVIRLRGGIDKALAALLNDEAAACRTSQAARSYFAKEMSFASNATKLRACLNASGQPGNSAALSWAAFCSHFANLAPLCFKWERDHQNLCSKSRQPIQRDEEASVQNRLKNIPRNWSASISKNTVPNSFAENVDVVVPVFNALDDVMKCLASIKSCRDGFSVKVIVVNDGSDEETARWLRAFCRQDAMFQLIEHGKNLGYTKAVNAGLRVSSAPYVIAQNSDTIVTRGWLSGLIRCLKSDSKIGIVGPLSNAASWQNVPNLHDASGAFAVNELSANMTAEDMAHIVAAASRRSYPRLPFVNGFCFMIKRPVIEAIGYMDEDGFPIGYGEENDYCIRAAGAGFDLAIADDVYVFHAKSKSFGHDRRKELSKNGTETLKRKHTPAKFNELVEQVKKTEKLDLVRSLITKNLADWRGRDESIDIMSMRILFLLPVKGGGGGVHSVVQEVTEMRRLGVHARVAVLSEHKEDYLTLYSDIPNVDEIFEGFDADKLLGVAKNYDLVVATYFRSMESIKRIIDANPSILAAYYIQDYEPLFFQPDTKDWKIARDSYTLVPGTLLFSKTRWIADKVKQEHGLSVVKVEASIDHEVYKPQRKHRDGLIHIAAMIRPQTPRRAADRTMRVLSKLARANPGRLAFHLFGCPDKDPRFRALTCDFDFHNYGTLKRQEVAGLLGRCDVFVDLSDYQAFGRTALEAMACGCTSVVPMNGGVSEYAVDGVNSLIVDTFDEESTFNRVRGLLNELPLLRRMQIDGLATAAKFSLNRAAVSELKVFREYASSRLLRAKNVNAPKESATEAGSDKLPITVLIISWDVGHNPLGRSYMLAEVVDRIARHVLLVGFQFPQYGNDIWEPVRNGRIPVIAMPGTNLPELHERLCDLAPRIRPDVVIACKPRLPSVELGILVKEWWGCPLIIDFDDHELSFFKNQTELQFADLAAMPEGFAAKDVEPYGELWTRLSQSLCRSADQIIVSNIALQQQFGGIIVPHVRDEVSFDPELYQRAEVRQRYGLPEAAKIVLFFGTARAHKGLGILAEAISRVANPNFRLLVVGTAPDKGFAAKLDTIAPGRIIYLPNQPFSAIPEILSMADVVCLPQDESHPISQYQLPAKAIDAIAMGVPLLVSRTPPMMQLVNDRVAELVNKDEIPAALERMVGDTQRVARWRKTVRERFLARYSYAAAAKQMREVIQDCLTGKQSVLPQDSAALIAESRRVLGVTARALPAVRAPGIDIVLFWKQNDTGLYGRRHDMVIKYLSSRPDVRKIIVFDYPISESRLTGYRQNNTALNHSRWIYMGTYEKLLGIQDMPKISYNVFVFADGITVREKREGYLEYINQIFKREQVRPRDAMFWVYPRDFFAAKFIRHFKPVKVVVDVVDDHRTWPGQTEDAKASLTNNYRDILSAADMVFTNCESVQRSMREFFPGTRLVPNGCDSNPPQEKPKSSADYGAFCAWPGKTIGFIGNLEKKIDVILLGKLAERFRSCQIVLIGSTHANPDVAQLKRYPNVRMPGVVPYRQAGAWISRFDVGLVPHLNSELTQNMNPLKVFVYLSLNVPVVSTEVYNVERNSELVRLAASHEDFLGAVAATLERGRPQRDVSTRYVAANSWETRLEEHVNELLHATRGQL